MLKVVGCLIAVLVGLVVVSGIAVALLDQPPDRIGITVVGCDGVGADYGRTGDRWTMSVRVGACHPSGRAALSSEQASFATLGAAAWRTPGPSLNSIAITLGRSADRPDSRAPPRTLVLTGEQAASRWGARPVRPVSDTRAALGDVVWLAGFGAAGLSYGVAAALAACAARHAGVVAIWWR